MLIVLTMAASLGIVLAVSRLVRVEGRLALLIAVGSAVCGNTAIVATAPVIGAKAREVAYAVATITLFGTLAVFLYPAIGRAIVLPQPSFGLWAGVAVHDTSQVIATSAAYGPDALDVATVVKLIRNALMAPLLFLIATGWAARGGEGVEAAGRGVRRAVPLFVFGFLALAALRTIGVIDAGPGGHPRHAGPRVHPRRARRGRDVDPCRGAARDELATAGGRLLRGAGGRTRHVVPDRDARPGGRHRGLSGRPGSGRMSVSCYPANVAIETLAPARPGSTPDPGPIVATWLGRVPYGEALALQKRSWPSAPTA